MTTAATLEQLTARLAAAGFVAAADEARQLTAAAGADPTLLDRLTERRLTGEPLAWITGSARFCGLDIHIDPGVYVPRPHTELLARRGLRRLAAGGVAIDLCTGSGALAAALMAGRPDARVVATDIDPRACACARRNGVEAYLGDLFAPLPAELGEVDMVIGAVPNVPTAELSYLQRDTFRFETRLAYDGGGDGSDILRRVLADAPGRLRPGGVLLLELGGRQLDGLGDDLGRHGFAEVSPLVDDDGDVRGLEATFAPGFTLARS
jgi:release factor glutamine methyltransferase